MSFLYVWHRVPVNKSKRPFLTENEHHIFAKDGVGIYQGKLKIKSFQKGLIYLTNKRVIYLDLTGENKAVAINLSDVASTEYVERFLRSSPKVKIFLKVFPNSQNFKDEQKYLDSGDRGKLPRTIDWVCGICSFNNHMSLQINLMTDFPKCVSCGIQPPQKQIEAVLENTVGSHDDSGCSQSSDTNPDQCLKCTFINHPSMRFCEVCGAPLKQASKSDIKRIKAFELSSSNASNPLGLQLEEKESYTNDSPYVKISFRKGGDVEFHNKLNEMIDKIKWAALEAKGGVSDDSLKVIASREATPRVQSRGIQGLVKISEFQRKQTEQVLSLSLEDLEQLMHKAQEILDLTSSFSSLIKFSQPLSTTMSPLLVSRALSIYHQELARHMCEYLLNLKLTKFSSMITSQDLFASYNRFTIMNQGFGGDLVTTQDFQSCLQLFESLNLPVRLKTYQSGLVVITQRLQDLQDIHQVILEHLVAEENRFLYEKYKSELLADTDGYMRSVYKIFRGKTMAEIADNFGWSSTICAEELARCEEEGLVVLDKHVLGTFYFVNKFDASLAGKIQEEAAVKEQAQADVLTQQNLISSNLKSQQECTQNLLTLQEFDFGAQPATHEMYDSTRGPNSEIPVSESLNLLSGLKFESE